MSSLAEYKRHWTFVFSVWCGLSAIAFCADAVGAVVSIVYPCFSTVLRTSFEPANSVPLSVLTKCLIRSMWWISMSSSNMCWCSSIV